MRKVKPVELSEDEKAELESWSRGRSTEARLVLRAKVVLRAAAGLQDKQIAAELKTARTMAAL